MSLNCLSTRLKTISLALGLGLVFLASSGTAQAAAQCLSTKPSKILIDRLGGYSHHAFTAWVARTNVGVSATDASGKAVSVCGVKITFRDAQGFTASCTTAQGQGGTSCQMTRGYSNSIASTRWTSVSVEHAGARFTQQVCNITANKPGGWFGTKQHTAITCTRP